MEKKREPLFLCCFCGALIKKNRNNLERHEKLHSETIKRIKCSSCKSTFSNKANYWKHWMQKYKDIIMPNALDTVIKPGKEPKAIIKRTLKMVEREGKSTDEKPTDFYILNALGLIHKVETKIKIKGIDAPFFGKLD